MVIVDKDWLIVSIDRRLNDAKYYCHKALITYQAKELHQDLDSISSFLRYDTRVKNAIADVIYSLKSY